MEGVCVGSDSGEREGWYWVWVCGCGIVRWDMIRVGMFALVGEGGDGGEYNRCWNGMLDTFGLV